MTAKAHSSAWNFPIHCAQRVDAKLEGLLQDQEAIDPRLWAAIRHSLLGGGKRIRPMLVYGAALAMGEEAGVNRSSGSDAAAMSVELLHCYSLIHDDLPAMDNDDLRRGRPTCHIAFDEATAILAGDALQALAFQVLAEAELPAANALRMCSTLASAAGGRGMVAGQSLDLQAEQRQQSAAELEQMHRLKTGALIRASLVLGGLSVLPEHQLDDHRLQALETFGHWIGLAFQVQDDILDVTADTATLGKQQGADIHHHKSTYVSLHGLDGARDHLQDYYQRACAALEALPRAQELRQLAAYIVERHF